MREASTLDNPVRLRVAAPNTMREWLMRIGRSTGFRIQALVGSTPTLRTNLMAWPLGGDVIPNHVLLGSIPSRVAKLKGDYYERWIPCYYIRRWLHV